MHNLEQTPIDNIVCGIACCKAIIRFKKVGMGRALA
jgi:hypothetical protein